MIEISNEELAKVLNLWTGTEEWHVPGDEDIVSSGNLLWDDYGQRKKNGTLFAPMEADKEAHDLVNFMLRERKYPSGGGIYFPAHADKSAVIYTDWVRSWEKRFGGMSQEELCIPSSEQTVERPVCQDIPTDSRTKGERFYAFLATPQPDTSPGLWGIAAMAGAPVRGSDGGWARKDVGGLTDGSRQLVSNDGQWL